MVRRIFVEKKKEFAHSAKALAQEIRGYLGLDALEDLRVFIRYDVENIDEATFAQACRGVFAEPPVDRLFHEEVELPDGGVFFGVEYLPGQFDQRADSAVQCIQLLAGGGAPRVRASTWYWLGGALDQARIEAVKAYVINPVDSREASLDKPQTLDMEYPEPAPVALLEGFLEAEGEALEQMYRSLGLAMTLADFAHIQAYFRREERRQPSMTEIRVLDTYWSDHCRHTTFSTVLSRVQWEEGRYMPAMQESYRQYMADREALYGQRLEEKPVCLMDLALMAMKTLRSQGKLEDMEESEEINACSIVVPIEVERDGERTEEEWLLFFKNETHNHPTEIEPFGGAATCLGGAIRDPLSGRGYVYQAMRVTGAADPRAPLAQTRKGKLPQSKIVKGAAHGYSSYGNQIGLATGLVREVYHPGYEAKRMEIGAVMGAAKRGNVQRGSAEPGDVIILLGGRTGRDGIGGATGSSKVHTENSLESCGAEVQKGNAPTERKIQRLFSKPEVSRLIKKCNDFGAGGVSVAIGELARGLIIDLDKVPKKYAGLDGTELAISESQERMALVVDPAHEAQMLEYAREENLEAVTVARVTDAERLVLLWRGEEIVNLSRAFLDTNGARQEMEARVSSPAQEDFFGRPADARVASLLEQGAWDKAWEQSLENLNTCSQKGLVEMFDSSIGAATVLMPYGGRRQWTPSQTMAALLPVRDGSTDAASLMSYGYDPYLSSYSPYHGAAYAVVESLAKIAAVGGDCSRVRFTFQEYFCRLGQDPARWGLPLAALLGAYSAQMGLGLPSIGGKDSMSGSFGDLDVPPTLVSFAVAMGRAGDLAGQELKHAGHALVHFPLPKAEYDLPDYGRALELYVGLGRMLRQGQASAAYALDAYGLAPALAQMAFGNGLGVEIDPAVDPASLFAKEYGGLVAEVDPAHLEAALALGGRAIGRTSARPVLAAGGLELELEAALAAYRGSLAGIFPDGEEGLGEALEAPLYKPDSVYVCKHRVAKPRVFIPIFPGTNCEMDSARAFVRAGAEVRASVFSNLRSQDIEESAARFVREIEQAQILFLPGGFSGGDEPDGSAKFFAAAFQEARIKEAIEALLDKRDGLALGICNGFQALIKLGLLPHGRIVGQEEDAPTLTFNTIGRHISKVAYTKVCSHLSPWLAGAGLGGVYANPVSHGEGRFVASPEWMARLEVAGQIATRYCSPDGVVYMGGSYNCNGSFGAVEGITSADGRILGKMAHSERIGAHVASNIYGEPDLGIFASGVRYFGA